MGLAMKKAALVYLAILVMATLACALKPVSDWDAIPYMGLVRHNHNPAAVYADLKQRVPAQEYAVLTGAGDGNGSSNEFKGDIFTHPEHLAEQLPFYKVKPLFLALAWVLTAAGLSAFTALHLISAIAFFGTGCVIWSWISKYVMGWVAVPVAATILLQPFMIQTARALLPDALGMALVVSGAYYAWELRRTQLGYGLLLFAILARPDNIIFCVLFFALCRALVPLASAISLYLLNNYFAHSYGWSKLFYNTFVHPLTMPKETAVHVGAKLYFNIFASNSLNLVTHSELLLIGAIGLWIAIAFTGTRKFSLVCVATIALHQIAFPLRDSFGANRFYAPEYLLLILLAASSILSRRAEVDAVDEQPQRPQLLS